MTLIDTHCHLEGGYFDESADRLIERAKGRGIAAFVCIGVGGLDASRAAVELAVRRSDVVATVGVHPHDAQSSGLELERALSELLSHERVVAIGEIGLDHHYDHSPRPVQAAVFRRFIALARIVNKPIVVHTRSAPEQTLEILTSERAGEVGGVIHCFSEDRAFAERALDLGFDLSFSGIVTFKNARAIQEVAAWAPEDRILIETDSPYLAPVPMRGKKCEPAFVVYTAERIAELRGTNLERIARVTTENACRRFGPRLTECLSASV